MKQALKIDPDGHIVLSAEMMTKLGVKPGDTIVVEATAPQDVAEDMNASADEMARFIGCLKTPAGPRLTLDGIQDVIRQDWAGRT